MSLPRWLFAVCFSFVFPHLASAAPRPFRIIATANTDVPIDALVFWSSEQLIALDRDGQVGTWDLRTGKLLGNFYVGQMRSHAAVSPDGALLFAAMGVWDLASEKVVLPLKGYGGVAICSSLVANGYGPGIRLYDIKTHLDSGYIPQEPDTLKPLAFSVDGNLLAVEAPGFGRRGISTRVLLFDTVTKQVRTSVAWPAFRVRAHISADKRMLAVGGYGTVLMCSTEKDKVLWRVGAPEHNAMFALGLGDKIDPALAFSPDDRLLALAAGEVVDVYETATGKLRCSLAGHQRKVSSLAFSLDGKSLASGAGDSRILLWNLRGPDPAVLPLRAPDLERVWSQLANGSGLEVHEAIARLVNSPKQAVAFLEKKLPPPKPVVLDPDRIKKLIADLGDQRFSVRSRAQAELEVLGPIVAGEVRKARKDASSLEMSLRLGRILKKLDDLALNQEWLRKRRAIEALELIGSPEAVKLLEQQAPQHAQDQIAADARVSLKRIRQGPIRRRAKALKKEPMPLRDGVPVPNPETLPLPAGQRITWFSRHGENRTLQ